MGKREILRWAGILARLAMGVMLGSVGGVILGVLGVLLFCVAVDLVMYPGGAPAGAGAGSYGWIFFFVSVPLGAGLGAVAGFAWQLIRMLRR